MEYTYQYLYDLESLKRFFELHMSLYPKKCDLLIGRLMIYSSLVGEHLHSNLIYSKFRNKEDEIMESLRRQDPKKWNIGKSIDPSREFLATWVIIPPGQMGRSCLRNRKTHKELT